VIPSNQKKKIGCGWQLILEVCFTHWLRVDLFFYYDLSVFYTINTLERERELTIRLYQSFKCHWYQSFKCHSSTKVL
jgi:hypothetical protein